jgi:hypothetical protein
MAQSKAYFATVAEDWDEIRAGYLTAAASWPTWEPAPVS